MQEMTLIDNYMKKKFLVVLFAVLCTTLLYAQEDSKDWELSEMLYEDINNDGIQDSVKMEFCNTSYFVWRLTLYINSPIGKPKIRTKEFGSESYLSKEIMESFDIFKGGFCVILDINYDEDNGDQHSESSSFYYKYFFNLDEWYLVGEKYEHLIPEGKSEFYVSSLKHTQKISESVRAEYEEESIYSLQDSVLFNKKFNQTYIQYLQEYKAGKNDLISKYGLIETIEYFQYLPLTTESLVKFNDIAFFLCEAKKYQESIDILEILLRSYPKRTVAYINLGDAYWGNNEKKYSKDAYLKYIERMKASGKECEIPKRVFERVK